MIQINSVQYDDVQIAVVYLTIDDGDLQSSDTLFVYRGYKAMCRVREQD